MISPRLFERLPMISVHPDSATREDIAELAGELMETRRDLLASQAEAAILRTELEQYRVQVEERYGVVAQWQNEAETNRQAWLKSQAEVATLRRELGQQVCRVCDTPIGYTPHPDSCSFCQSARDALAAVQAAPAPQE